MTINVRTTVNDIFLLHRRTFLLRETQKSLHQFILRFTTAGYTQGRWTIVQALREHRVREAGLCTQTALQAREANLFNATDPTGGAANTQHTPQANINLHVHDIYTRRKIKQCDAAISLLGRVWGGRPPHILRAQKMRAAVAHTYSKNSISSQALACCGAAILSVYGTALEAPMTTNAHTKPRPCLCRPRSQILHVPAKQSKPVDPTITNPSFKPMHDAVAVVNYYRNPWPASR